MTRQIQLVCRRCKAVPEGLLGRIGGHDVATSIRCPVCGVESVYEEAQDLADRHYTQGFRYSHSEGTHLPEIFRDEPYDPNRLPDGLVAEFPSFVYVNVRKESGVSRVLGEG